MATFVLNYRAPKGYVPGEASAAGPWQSFIGGLSDHLVDLGRPVVGTRGVGVIGDATQLGGYSVIEADDFESALTLAKGCPFVGHGGGVEVGELGDVPPATA